MIRFIERNVEWIVSCCVVLALVLGAVLYQQLQARDPARSVAPPGPAVVTEAAPPSTQAASGAAGDAAATESPAQASSDADGAGTPQDIQAR